MRDAAHPHRRDFMLSLAAAGASAAAGMPPSLAQPGTIATRPIPTSGEALPVIGLGSWITFNVGNDPQGRDACAAVMRAFFARGGKLIDSSPMYGSSQPVIGYGLTKLEMQSTVFSADKVWTSSGKRGPEQIETSRRYWNVPRFDLLQVHNLLNWEEHLPGLFAMKAEKTLRYVGVTTSEGRRHGELERIMQTQPLDFIQVTYNPLDREVEKRILPLARERGIGVIVNRPFRQGDLIHSVEKKPLPDWAGEIDCANWAQVILKFIASHPAITCAIPATSQVAHVQQNIGAAYGRMPDQAMRGRIAAHIKSL